MGRIVEANSQIRMKDSSVFHFGLSFPIGTMTWKFVRQHTPLTTPSSHS